MSGAVHLEHELVVAAPPPRVWETVWDIVGVSRCIPGCGEVMEIEPRRRYRATIESRVGPFRVTMPVEVTVDESRAGRLGLAAAGRDVALGSPVRLALELGVDPLTPGSRIQITGRAEVGGKLGALGQGLVERKAREILAAFATALGRLVDGPRNASTV
jgi:carbon monoxide dehydrogenase subunit G